MPATTPVVPTPSIPITAAPGVAAVHAAAAAAPTAPAHLLLTLVPARLRTTRPPTISNCQTAALGTCTQGRFASRTAAGETLNESRCAPSRSRAGSRAAPQHLA